MALYDYDPFKSSPNPNPATELGFKEGDILRVLDTSRKDGFYVGKVVLTLTWSCDGTPPMLFWCHAVMPPWQFFLILYERHNVTNVVAISTKICQRQILLCCFRLSIYLLS